MKTRKMLAILFGMLMAIPSGAVMAQKSVSVTINNENVVFKDVAPFIDSNNRTLVPLRFISEELGAQVEWDQVSGTATIMKDNMKVILTVGQTTMIVDGKTKEMDTKPIMQDGRLFVPVKYIGEILNVEVKWLAKDNTVVIMPGITGDAVVAKVGDLTITAKDILDQLEYEMMMIQYQYQYDDSFFETEEAKQYMEQRKGELVDYIIKNKVALIKGRELKLEPTVTEVNNEFNKAKEDYGTAAEFEKALVNSGLTVERYKAQIKDSLTISNVAKYISNHIAVTNAEIKSYYESNSGNYTMAPGAEMSHILVATEEEAKAIKAEYDKGTSFAELAKKYGTDGTKDTGGELGYIAYDSSYYDQDFLNGAKTLEEGQVSNPVKTQFGWHLIKVLNVHKEAYRVPLEEIKEDLKNIIISEKATEFIYSQLDEWGKEMTIEKYEDIITKL